jgi:hypothetical protein
MNITRDGSRALLGALLILSAFGCAAHREAAREEERKEREALQQAQQKIHDCIVEFVLRMDSPRLTGFELTEAGAAACAGQAAKLNQLAIDQDNLTPRQIQTLVESTIKAGQQDALAALAVKDHQPVSAPVKNAPLPNT